MDNGKKLHGISCTFRVRKNLYKLLLAWGGGILCQLHYRPHSLLMI